jgi:transposase
MGEITVVNTVRGPRKYLSASQRMAIVQESLEGGANVAVIARKHNVGVSSLVRWRKNALEGSYVGVKSDDGVVPANEVKKLKGRVRELERMLGRKTMENEILREAVELAREKKLISRQPLPGVEGMDKG